MAIDLQGLINAGEGGHEILDGSMGAGKTSILARLAERLRRSRINVIVVSHEGEYGRYSGLYADQGVGPDDLASGLGEIFPRPSEGDVEKGLGSVEHVRIPMVGLNFPGVDDFRDREGEIPYKEAREWARNTDLDPDKIEDESVSNQLRAYRGHFAVYDQLKDRLLASPGREAMIGVETLFTFPWPEQVAEIKQLLEEVRCVGVFDNLHRLASGNTSRNIEESMSGAKRIITVLGLDTLHPNTKYGKHAVFLDIKRIPGTDRFKIVGSPSFSGDIKEVKLAAAVNEIEEEGCILCTVSRETLEELCEHYAPEELSQLQAQIEMANRAHCEARRQEGVSVLLPELFQNGSDGAFYQDAVEVIPHLQVA